MFKAAHIVNNIYMASEKTRLKIINVLENIKGKLLLVKVHKGRKKYFSFKGFIKNVYPYIFTVFEEESEREYSFSFSDLLSKDITIEIV